MLLKGSLKRWEAEELISSDVGTAILEFEKERKSGRFMFGLICVGALTIVLGILAIIGANWYAVPGGLKIGGHLLVNLALMFGVLHFDKKDMPIRKEFSLVGLGALTLTLIALVGQVFHLNGSEGGAMILWMCLVTPLFVMFGKTYISLVPWVVALVSTMFVALVDYDLFFFDEGLTFIVLGLMVSLALIAASFLSRKLDPEANAVEHSPLTRVLIEGGCAAAIITASIVSLIGGSEFIHQSNISGEVAFMSVGFVAVFCAVPWAFPISLSLRITYMASVVAVGLSVMLGTDWDDLMASFIFCVYWVAIGFVAFREDRNALMNFSLSIIALRMYGVYIDAYHNLADTGFGLIISGLLLIGLGYGTQRCIKLLGQYKLEKKGE
jgi:uncharacterized membrane protein